MRKYVMRQYINCMLKSTLQSGQREEGLGLEMYVAEE